MNNILHNFVVADVGDFWYLEAAEGTNCAIDQIITSESQCKYVIFKMEGVTYQRINMKRYDRPAGCFHEFGIRGHFNKIVDSSATIISSNEHYKGICKHKRTLN